MDYSFYLFHGMVYICILEKKILGSTPSFYYYYDLFKLAPPFLPTSWQKLDDGFDAQKVHVCLSLLKSKHPYIVKISARIKLHEVTVSLFLSCRRGSYQTSDQ